MKVGLVCVGNFSLLLPLYLHRRYIPHTNLPSKFLTAQPKSKLFSLFSFLANYFTNYIASLQANFPFQSTQLWYVLFQFLVLIINHFNLFVESTEFRTHTQTRLPFVGRGPITR